MSCIRTVKTIVTLVTASGERTLLDVQGNPETYGIGDACWSPDFQWIMTNDTRMLIITTGEPPVTRALTPPMTTFYGYDALSWYAVTDADLLSEPPEDHAAIEAAADREDLVADGLPLEPSQRMGMHQEIERVQLRGLR